MLNPAPLPKVRVAEVLVAPSRRTLEVAGLVNVAVSAAAGTVAGVQFAALFQRPPVGPVKSMVAAASGLREPAKVVAVEIRSEERDFIGVAGNWLDF
jgi:hypothetical protein